MSNIYFFRGKAATGKTLITNTLSKKIGKPIFRKDDIYDKLSRYDLSHNEINVASYDILSEIIATNIYTNNDLIIDVSLVHTPYLNQFLSKINLNNCKVYHFLCICSNHNEWKDRMSKRIANPLPNQFFKSVEEAEEHYNKLHKELLNDEILIDSSEDIESIINYIVEIIEEKFD